MAKKAKLNNLISIVVVEKWPDLQAGFHSAGRGVTSIGKRCGGVGWVKVWQNKVDG